MDRDTIIRLARQAGVHATHTELTLMAALERFAALVAAHEREECAKLCDEEANDLSISEHWSDCGEYIANRIRSRT